MKKLIAASGLLPYLALVPSAFAQGNVNPNLNPCPEGTQFGALCGFTDLGGILGFIVTIAFIAAVIIALGFLILGGIKWITSGGDKTGVEAARNQIIAAVIGLIVVFLSFFILNLVLGLFDINLFRLRLPTIREFVK